MKAGSSDNHKTVTLPAGRAKRDKLATSRTPDIADTFSDEQDDVLDAVGGATDAGDDDILTDADKAAIVAAMLAALQNSQPAWSDALLDVHQDAADAASQSIMDALPADFPVPDDFSPSSSEDPQLAEWSKSAADSITSSTGDRLTSLVNDSSESATLSDVSKSVSDAYDTWQGAQDGGDVNASRSSVIAGDTVQAGWGFGETDTVGALLGASDGTNAEQQWNTVGDDRVRPSHQDADGQVAGPGEPFSVGGDELMFPGDPDGSDEETINCRCYLTTTLSYVPMDDSEKARRLQTLARLHRRDAFRAFREVTTG